MTTLLSHRNQIDSIDKKILELLNQRAEHAQAIGAIKIAQGDTEMYRPEREAQVLRKHIENNTGPIPDLEIARLFREIMSTCLSLEKPLSIAYLGPEKTFTELAARKIFGGAADLKPQPTINEVFRSVETGTIDYGVVPIENSTEGAVNLTLDCFLNSSLSICGETELRIHQNLISSCKDFSEIKTIFAHPQSLAQCRNWLDFNLPSAKRVACNSNIEALLKSKESPLETGSIASIEAAQFYDIPVLAKSIEDEPNNTTRFFAIGNKIIERSGQDKTTFIVSADDRPGLLSQLIEPLSTHQVTMTRLESRPSKNKMWGYIFFIDVLGHQEDDHLKKAFLEIRNRSSLLRILGSYPISNF